MPQTARYELTPLQAGLAFQSLKAVGSGHYVEQTLVTLSHGHCASRTCEPSPP